jgi:hypothetical protein
LAHIFPSRGNDNIVEVRVQTVSLDESPVYDALSYCWGDPSITSAIRVNGQERDVTINLEAALRQFRLQTGDGDGAILWVDAICINQDDKFERAQQVAIMPDVYRSAERVRAWLGDLPFDALYAFRRLLEKAESRTRIKQSTQSSWTEDEKASALADLDSILRPAESRLEFVRRLAVLSQSSYWTRIWIIQEAALARWFSLHMGDICMDMSDERTGRWARPYGFLSDLSNATSKISAEEAERFDLSMEDSLEIRSIAIKLCWALSNISVGLASAYIAEEGLGGEAGLDELNFIMTSRDTKCADPRDSAFAFQGIHPKSMAITPDYEATVAEIFGRFTLRVIRTTRSLKILEQACSDNNDLPSWVPDSGAEDPTLRSNHGFDASIVQTIYPAESGLGSLLIPALFVSKIVVIPSSPASGGLTERERTLQIYESWNEAYLTINLTTVALNELEQFPVDLENRDALWDILNFDTSQLSDQGTVYELRRWLMGALRGSHDQDASNQRLLQGPISLFKRFNDKYHFFVAGSGDAGAVGWLQHNPVAVGDSIMIIAFARVPFCVRPVQHGETEAFKLFSTCHIPGRCVLSFLSNGILISTRNYVR